MNEKFKAIKQEFFALRNGIIADTLRSAGSPYRMIFGLNVPQLAEIARKTGVEQELAFKLWEDNGVRESRLLAAYLFDKHAFRQSDAIALIEGCGDTPGIQTREEADMLCFRLLKHLPFAKDLVGSYSESDEPLHRYLARSLRNHLE